MGSPTQQLGQRGPSLPSSRSQPAALPCFSRPGTRLAGPCPSQHPPAGALGKNAQRPRLCPRTRASIVRICQRGPAGLGNMSQPGLKAQQLHPPAACINPLQGPRGPWDGGCGGGRPQRFQPPTFLNLFSLLSRPEGIRVPPPSSRGSRCSEPTARTLGRPSPAPAACSSPTNPSPGCQLPLLPLPASHPHPLALHTVARVSTAGRALYRGD